MRNRLGLTIEDIRHHYGDKLPESELRKIESAKTYAKLFENPDGTYRVELPEDKK